jgi:hypothetical protein
MNQICVLMQTEKDHERFTALVKELNELLDAKERRFAEDCKRDPLLCAPNPKYP